ncbi:TAXI family TRAP transporter solute-binding subunit [Halococcus dombrowskii]|uniref:TAXI family TRAP transporter solute-binding subunit n=1 Tax=Halococcus dombrowskii TaxID=179637 RepID=A0AAV3SDV7_HALDO|nr:TAXI family TRAP transporter solute-binding subunit [Halococcus dombrowskii]UOO95073.1 TAXI family TRAP transporter solute-binding subunit [Halococcus dombrowskii]
MAKNDSSGDLKGDTTGSSRRTFLRTAGALGVVGATGLAGCAGGGGDNGSGGNGTSGGSGGGNGSGGNGSGGGGGGSNNLVWDAGGTGGTYYPLSNEIKQVVQSNTDFSLQVRSTGASVENVGSLADGSADFALIQNDIASFAKNGTGIDAFQDNAIKNLRGVATLYPETITVVTPGSSDVEKIADLSGKTINTGDLGSGTQVDAKTILEAVGVSDFTEQNTDFSQAAEQIQNGDIDASFVVGGWPVGAISELAETSSIGIVAIDGDERKQVKQAADFFANDEIPGGTYQGVSDAKPTVAVQAMIATTTQVPEETVQNVTAAIFDNVSDLTIKTDSISADSAQDGMSIDLHPGAAAYFDSAGGGSGTASGGTTMGGGTTMDGGTDDGMGTEAGTAMGNDTTSS